MRVSGTAITDFWRRASDNSSHRKRDRAMDETHTFTLSLEQLEDYEFRVKFDWPEVPDLVLDEPVPLGRSSGPNAARLIAAAVANCLSSSLLFCMRKFKQTPAGWAPRSRVRSRGTTAGGSVSSGSTSPSASPTRPARSSTSTAACSSSRTSAW